MSSFMRFSICATYFTLSRNELKAERNHSFDQSIKLSELERRCKRAERLLSKIPQEELDKLLPKQKGLER